MLSLLLALVCSSDVVENEEVTRHYTIDNGLVIVTVQIYFNNLGDKSLDKYLFTIEDRELKHLNKITASKSLKTCHNYDSSFHIERNDNKFLIHLDGKVAPGASMTLFVGYTLSNYLLFRQDTIKLSQQMQPFFNTTLKMISPFKTKTSYLKIEGIYSNSIVSSSEPNYSVIVKGKTITIGPVKADDMNEEVFYEFKLSSQNFPLYIKSLVVETVVSHWGKSKQNVHIDMKNAGPKFVGQFNRIDFREEFQPNYVQNAEMIPPKSSYDFWAHDESGQLQRTIEKSGDRIIIPLRGPMLSSWGTSFMAGWTVDTSSFITLNDYNEYVYKHSLYPKVMTAGIGSVESVIVLPEGAKVEKLTIPDSVQAKTNITTKVFNLDFKGRTVITITAENLDTNTLVPVQISYTLPETCNFYKIFYIILSFSVLFFSIVILRRVDLTIEDK